jgi:hypothetical protein
MGIHEKIGEVIKEVISHEIDIITDSDWFEDLVEKKLKELMNKKQKIKNKGNV